MGKLIVLEGTDGSGKSTQMNLLAESLEKSGVPFMRLRFPRYEKDSSALIRLYLGGAFGGHPKDVNPYAASLFYAVDRYASYREDWQKFYENGGLLIADRYTTSNAVHQGSKLPPEEREAFFAWLADLEYGKMQLPEPDLVVWLDMPIALSEKLMRKRENQTQTTADIHEKDHDYLIKCHEAAAAAAAYYGWRRVACGKKSEIRTIEEVHGDVAALIQEVLG